MTLKAPFHDVSVRRDWLHLPRRLNLAALFPFTFYTLKWAFLHLFLTPIYISLWNVPLWLLLPTLRLATLQWKTHFPGHSTMLCLFLPLHSWTRKTREADGSSRVVPWQIVPVTSIQHTDCGVLLNLLVLRGRENYSVGCLVYQISCSETMLVWAVLCESWACTHLTLCHGWWWSGVYSSRVLGHLC